jgi:hypothetical protein
MSAIGEAHRTELVTAVDRAGACAGGWALRAAVTLTEWAAERLARSGRRQVELLGLEDEPEDTRFLNDVSGGGSRSLEAARWRYGPGRGA